MFQMKHDVQIYKQYEAKNEKTYYYFHDWLLIMLLKIHTNIFYFILIHIKR
jgi:hypothetical protein